MATEFPIGNEWLMEEDLFESLAGLLENGDGPDDNEVMSDLESCAQSSRCTGLKTEKGAKSAKKRKYNPDSDVIAAATDETLKQLDLDPNSKEGKAKRRQIRNRLSAQFHRDRKNAHMNTLEQQLANKDMEISSLKEQITALLAENEYLRKLNPGFAGVQRQRQHAASVSSYPGSITSQNHTDAEDTDTGLMYFLNPGVARHGGSGSSTCSASSVTVSPMDSPQHTAVEALLPGIPPNLPMPAVMNRRGNGATAMVPHSAHMRQAPGGAGTGMLHVPSGLARPLSIITMVCMVSIMLLGGTQSPGMGVSFQYTPYQQQQAAQRERYVQLLSGGLKEADLTVGSDVLSLVHTEAGAHNVETRHIVPLPAEGSAQVHTHGRRLTAEEDSSDESTEASHEHAAKRHRTTDTATAAGSRSRSNSLFDENLMTPEEEAAASTAISTLNLESIAPPHLLQQHNATTRPHNHLRRSHADMDIQDTLHAPPQRRNSSRQVIYSSGVVSRGLVEDSIVYNPHPHRGSVFDAGAEAGESSQRHGARAYPSDGMFGSDEYQWPASQAFDYAVQSYSKVVLTEGQALLDPSLALHKNPFAWTRALFQRGDGEHGYAEESEEGGMSDMGRRERRRTTERAPSIIEHGEAGFGKDMDVAEDSAALVRPAVRLPHAPVVRALPAAAATTAADEAVPSNAVVPVIKHELANVPAVLHHAAYDAGYDGEVPTERSVLNKLLSESNFMTLKLPASSIRVGKSWGDSKSGTVESIMEVFNITAPDGNAQSGETATFRVPASTEASVEINCIILGAKLVVSESTAV